jgi:sugar phosphate isomerase/epimerase
MRIGFMQGRLLESENTNFIQYFPSNNWKQELLLAKKNKLNTMEWTVNLENIKKNPIYRTDLLFEAIKIIKKYKILVNSVTCDFFMQKPFFKSKKKKLSISILKKIIKNGNKLGIKYFILPLVDNSSIKNKLEEKKLHQKLVPIAKYLQKRSMILFESDYEPRKVLDFINKFDHRFGINYDTGNSAHFNYKISDEKIYFHRVRNIHIKDRFLKGNTVALGKGHWKYKPFFKLIKKIKYKGNLILQTARSKQNLHLEEILNNKKFIKKYL